MVVGTANDEAWSQVQIFPILNGQVIELLSLKYEGEGGLLDLAEIGGSLLESLRGKGEVKEEELGEVAEEVMVTVVMLKRIDNQVEISGKGQAEVYLARGGKVGKIFSGSEKIQKMTGEIREGDKLMALTSETAEEIGIKTVKETVMGGLSELEKLAVTVHKKDDSSQLAVAVAETIRVGEPESLEAEAPAYAKVKNMMGLKERLNIFGNKLVVKRPLFLAEEKRKRNLWIGLALMALLAGGVVMGIAKRATVGKERDWIQLEANVSQAIREAKDVGDLNPERAKSLLRQSKEQIDLYQERTKDEKYKNRAGVLEEELTKTETEVFKKQEVAINTLTELSVLRENLNVQSMQLDEEGNILLPDQDGTEVIGMNVEDKSSFEIKTGVVGKVRELAEGEREIFGITERGIAQINYPRGSASEPKIVIEPDELWGEIALIDVFAGNIYLLDRGQSDIWKYPVLNEGFGSRRRWLGAGIELDLTNVVDMKVDGDIWVLTSSGKLERYSRGVPVDFAMEGFPAVEAGRLASPVAVYLTETEVLVLEKGARRVVVFDIESGKYLRQYGNEVLGEGKDLVVYEDKAYVLLPDKIVWFQL